MKVLMLVLLALSSWQAHASAGDRGNGGDVVVCRTPGSPATVQLLDLYEGNERGIHYDLGPASLPYMEKALLVIDRFAAFDPFRAALYREKLKNFENNTRFTRGRLKDIPDSGYVPIPEFCTIEQIAEQREPYFPEDRLYTIVEDYWKALDSDHKAGLILHEIVYGEALRQGQQDSIKSRYFTSIICSDRVSSMTMEEYHLARNLTFGPEKALAFKSSLFLWTYADNAEHRVPLNMLLSAPPTSQVGFRLDDAPAWVQIEKGELLITPKNVGPNSFRFSLTVIDGQGNHDTTAIHINILPRPSSSGLRWKKNPIVLSVQAGVGLYEKLGALLDRDDRAYSMELGSEAPKWIRLSRNGTLTANPGAEHAGVYEFEVLAFDQLGGEASAQVKLTVVPDDSPTQWIENEILVGTLYAGTESKFDLSQFVSGGASAKLNYGTVVKLGWVQLGYNGVLTFNPTEKDVGPFSFDVIVTDGDHTSVAKLQGQVQKNSAFFWRMDSFSYQATGGVPFSLVLSEWISNPKGGRLFYQFSNPIPPPWLSLSSNGTLVGDPPPNEHSTTYVRIVATDGKMSRRATLMLQVRPARE